MSTGSHSPPATLAEPFDAQGPHCPRRPTLREILDNSSQPPWTLAAFMAYLSSNHCLETLEFTMDASRYRKHYAKMLSRAANQPNGQPPAKDCEYVRELWRRLVGVYIQPSGAREVNLPSHVRDPILDTPASALPPPPETLDLAVSTIYELMEESVLAPFLNSFQSQINHVETYTQPHATVPSRTTSDESLTHDERTFTRKSRHLTTSPSPPRQHLQQHRHRFSHHSSTSRSGGYGTTASTPSPTRNHDPWSTRLMATTSAPTEGSQSHFNHAYDKPSSSDQYLYKSDSASTGTGPGMTDDTGSVGSVAADSPPQSHTLSPLAAAAQMAALQTQQDLYHHQQQQQQQHHHHHHTTSSSSFFTAHFEAADPKRERERAKLRERERDRAERDRQGLGERGDHGMWRKLGRLSGMKATRKRSQGALGEEDH